MVKQDRVYEGILMQKRAGRNWVASRGCRPESVSVDPAPRSESRG